MKIVHIKMIFDMLDWTAMGEIGFDQFYMLVCIVLSHQVSTRVGGGKERAALPSLDKVDIEVREQGNTFLSLQMDGWKMCELHFWFLNQPGHSSTTPASL